MNLYSISLDYMEYQCDLGDRGAYYTPEHADCLIVARSRGAARQVAMKEFEVHYTSPMSIKLVQKDHPQQTEGFLEYDLLAEECEAK